MYTEFKSFSVTRFGDFRFLSSEFQHINVIGLQSYAVTKLKGSGLRGYRISGYQGYRVSLFGGFEISGFQCYDVIGKQHFRD